MPNSPKRRRPAVADDRRPYDAGTIKQVRDEIKDLMETPRTLSGRQVIAEIIPDIKRAMKQGYTLEEIAAKIGPSLGLEYNTLRGYLYSKDKVGSAEDEGTRPARPVAAAAKRAVAATGAGSRKKRKAS